MAKTLRKYLVEVPDLPENHRVIWENGNSTAADFQAFINDAYFEDATVRELPSEEATPPQPSANAEPSEQCGHISSDKFVCSLPKNHKEDYHSDGDAWWRETGQEREEAERAEFERWAAGKLDLTIDRGKYHDVLTFWTNVGWLAGRAALRAPGKDKL